MRPDVFSKEQLNTVAKVCDNFMQDYITILKKEMGGNATFKSASVMQLTYEEFVRSLPNLTPAELFTVKGHNCVFSMSPNIALELCVSPFGEDDGKVRVLETYEKDHFSKKLAMPALKMLSKAGGNFGLFSHKFENNSMYYCCEKNINEMVCLISIDVCLGPSDIRSDKTCINGSIDIMLNKQTVYDICGFKPNYGDKKMDMKSIEDTKLPIEVVLGGASKTLAELKNMGEGTILELDKLAGEPVDIKVNGKIVAKGEVVVIDENFGVRVLGTNS